MPNATLVWLQHNTFASCHPLSCSPLEQSSVSSPVLCSCLKMASCMLGLSLRSCCKHQLPYVLYTHVGSVPPMRCSLSCAICGCQQVADDCSQSDCCGRAKLGNVLETAGNGGYGRLGHVKQQDEFKPRNVETFSQRVPVAPDMVILSCLCQCCTYVHLA